MDDPDSRSLAGTAGVRQLPFWSPNGQAIGFFADGKLKRIDLASGALTTICNAPNARGGTWGSDGTIVFAPNPQSGLYRVPADGGQPVEATHAQAPESHRNPAFLADGVHFVYTATPADGSVGIRIGTLGSTTTTELMRVAEGQGGLTQAVVSRGLLVFGRGGSIFAQPLDEARWRLTGTPMLLVRNVAFDELGRFAFAVSDRDLVYRSAPPAAGRLTWLSRNGEPGSTLWEPGEISQVVLSPNGRFAAVTRREGSTVGLWVIDTTRHNAAVRLATSSPEPLIWSRDGTRVLFAQTTALFHNEIHAIRIDGVGSEDIVVTRPDDLKSALGWSAGGALLYNALNPSTRRDLWESARPGVERLLIAASSPNTDFHKAAVSPGGRLIAHLTGLATLSVQPVGGGARVVVTSGGAAAPSWRADGRELFYLANERLMAVDVSPTEPVQIGAPRPLFEYRGTAVSPSPDGQRFLAVVPLDLRPATQFEVVVNWPSLLTR
jgi:hypothetical protein